MSTIAKVDGSSSTPHRDRLSLHGLMIIASGAAVFISILSTGVWTKGQPNLITGHDQAAPEMNIGVITTLGIGALLMIAGAISLKVGSRRNIREQRDHNCALRGLVLIGVGATTITTVLSAARLDRKH